MTASQHGHDTLAPAAACASVALDIGGGRGALVLYPGERFRGREIEIAMVYGSGPRVHTGVHERATRAKSVLTAIFGSLPAGDYVVWEDAVSAGPVVSVPDGGVAEVTLR
jgi:ethanolamine utilization protein EutA (predicted chaperonin)